MEIKDNITHVTTTRPKWTDRIKILLGGTIVVESTIAVDKEVNIIYSKATDRVELPKYLHKLTFKQDGRTRKRDY